MLSLSLLSHVYLAHDPRTWDGTAHLSELNLETCSKACPEVDLLYDSRSSHADNVGHHRCTS